MSRANSYLDNVQHNRPLGQKGVIMTYKNLKEYCEIQYKKVVEMQKGAQECPVCGKKHFFLYGNNLEFGKCHHCNCGLYLNLNAINGNVNYKSIILERFKGTSHEYLFTNDQNEQPIQAFIYANQNRKISENILKRSDIGAIPLNYDVQKENEDLIKELENKIEAEADIEKKEKYQTKLSELLNFLIKFQKFINDNYGKLAFFYRDEKELITQIKVRKPYTDTKSFQTFKANENAGVFNTRLFSPDEMTTKKNKKIAERMLIFEGEFDQLTFATLAMNNIFPVQSCALGGANGDLETALKLSDKTCLVYDNDNAGKSVLDRAKELCAIRAVTTPEPYKDIDEYINSFKDENECQKAIINLLDSAKSYHRELKGIKNQIRTIMKEQGNALDKQEKVTQIVIAELLQRGKFYKDNNFSYLFIYDTKRIIPIFANNEQLRMLLTRIGINPAKDYYQFVVNELIAYAHLKGEYTEMYNFCHYNPKSNVLYIFNNDKTIYKISTENIEILENGDEGIMFNYKSENEPFEYVQYDKNKNYFKDIILDYMNLEKEEGNESLTPDELKELLKLWFYSTFFHSIMPSKVILVASGEKGSGKTSTLRRLGIILFGAKYNVTPLPNKPEDFDTTLTNNHFVIFDNVDTKKQWLNDKLASAATGQTIQKRKLYTDNEEIKLPTKTFLAMTSRTKYFSRDDVADRLICLPFERIKSFITENELISVILENRNEIMSYIIDELQNIIRILAETENKKYSTKFRIADFAIFGLKINDILGQKEKFAKTLDKVSEVQKALATEEDSLIYCLKILAKYDLTIKAYSGFELYNKLLFLASPEQFNVSEFKLQYKSVKSLTKRLGNIKNNIIQDVKVTIYKKRANQKEYTFELMDKEFELPMTQNDLFDRGLEKAQNIEGGQHE